MSFKIITKQLALRLTEDHKLKMERVCDPQSYEDMQSILNLVPPSGIQLYDCTTTSHYKRGSIIPVLDHINRSGQNLLIGNGKTKKINFVDVSNLYHCNRNGIITDCCGKTLNSSFIYPSHFLCNLAIVAKVMEIKKIQGFLFNIYSK